MTKNSQKKLEKIWWFQGCNDPQKPPDQYQKTAKSGVKRTPPSWLVTLSGYIPPGRKIKVSSDSVRPVLGCLNCTGQGQSCPCFSIILIISNHPIKLFILKIKLVFFLNKINLKICSLCVTELIAREFSQDGNCYKEKTALAYDLHKLISLTNNFI